MHRLNRVQASCKEFKWKSKLLSTATASASSVDHEEIEKFSKIAQEWWNPESKSGAGPLHQLNPIRVAYIREKIQMHFRKHEHPGYEISQPFGELSILDVGCGGGLLAESLKRLGGNVTAIDPSEANIGIAKAHASQDPTTKDIQYLCKSSEDLVAEDHQFDVVCSLEVIEHVNNPQLFVDNLCQLLKPDGILFLSTLNRTMASYLLSIVAAEHVLRLVPPGTHDWKKYLTPEEMKTMLENNHMQVHDVTGIAGDPYLVKWHLSKKCMDINYILCATKAK